MAKGRKPKDDGGGTAVADKPEPGEQLDLIDVDPTNAKVLKRIATKYKSAMKARQQALAEEIKLKHDLIDAAKNAGIQADSDGKMKFSVDKEIEISITPRDELVKVKFVEESDEPD